MKKILITTESLTMGGVETALLSLLDFLNNYDVEVDLYCLEKGSLLSEYEKRTNVNIIPINLPKNRFFYKVNKSILTKRLIKKYKKMHHKKYDIAIAYYGLNNYSDMFAAAANAKKKIIWVHYNFYEHFKISKIKFAMSIRNHLMKSKFKYFDNIIPVSKSGLEGFKNVFKGYDDKLHVINNLVDVKNIKRKALDKAKLLKGEKKLIYVGRLEEYKRVDYLIEEFALVLKEYKDSKLYIVGNGSQFESLKKLILDKKLNKSVILLGVLNNPFPYIAQADIVVSASSSETYSIAILEALTLNKYFVSAHNSGADDAFYNTNKGNINNGIVCDLKDMHTFIIDYFENQDKRKPNFNISKENDKIINELLKLLNIKKNI